MEGTRTSLRQLLSSCWSIRPEDRRNQWIATGLLFVWAVGYVGTAVLIKREVVPAGAPTYLVALVPTAFGVLAVLAYIRFLRRADELLRRIQLEALALGFGAGFVGSFTFDLLETAGLGRAEASSTFLVMLLFYLLGLFVGARRYA
jgi:hypothetical protein